MNTLTIDIEADGFLEDVTKIHMVYVSLDGDTPEEFQEDELRFFLEEHQTIHDAVLVGHNILGYDLPVLEKLWGITWSGPVYDTLLASQIGYSDIRLISEKEPQAFPKRVFDKTLVGSHSLKAWGARLGFPKIEFDVENFKDPSEAELVEMHTYCAQDVALNYALYEFLRDSKRIPKNCLDLEQAVKKIIMVQEANGFMLDTEACNELVTELAPKRAALVNEVRGAFGDVLKAGKIFTPKQDNKRYGYKKDVPVQKVEFQEFNPGSGDHIRYWLKKKYGWKPSKFTPTGLPSVEGDVLRNLPYPEAEALAAIQDIDKILGYVSEGDSSWLRMVGEDGRIHGQVRTMGCVTSRMSHYRPNLGQIPRKGSMGKSCRKCFTVPTERVLVGADAAGLELRCLAHYLGAFDGGEYAKVVTEGDVHTFNQKAANCETRDDAKKFIYTWLYGGGDAKIGQAVGKGPKEGGRLKRTFLKSLPSVAQLRKAVMSKADSTGYLRGIDGRLLPIRADYAALNTLLQSCGAIIMKTALRELVRSLDHAEETGYIEGYKIVATVHDEVQVECAPDKADLIGSLMVDAIVEAGRVLGLRCPLDGEYQVGSSWAETH